MTDADDLARRLREQRELARYRRQRAVRQFSHRMRIAAVLVGLLAAMLWYVLSLLVLRWDRPYWLEAVTPLMLGLFWAYYLLLPLTFAWRTRLTAYLLQEHWLWLAACVGLPLDWLLFRARFHAWGIPILTTALLLLGWILRHQRLRRFQAELAQADALWGRLLDLGVLDLLSFGYWHARRGH